MAVDTAKVVNVGGFTSGQKQFLDFHRNAVLRNPTQFGRGYRFLNPATAVPILMSAIIPK